ncbi:MAG: hypothetical protein IPH31_03920 [Lewinellaceae bacterium]|nr:hypothetical protein [Lewinellaceae bacterium]
MSNVAVVLSGPEPQRTYLEQILLEQALALPHKFVFVKGKTGSKEHHIVSENVEVVSYLTTSDLQQLLLSSQIVVCRAGYSSIMDLAALGRKKAILVPTPGQTEQEYLGEMFTKQGIFLCQKQEEVDLEKGLKAVEETTGLFFPQMDSFETILSEWLRNLPEKHGVHQSRSNILQSNVLHSFPGRIHSFSNPSVTNVFITSSAFSRIRGSSAFSSSVHFPST